MDETEARALQLGDRVQYDYHLTREVAGRGHWRAWRKVWSRTQNRESSHRKDANGRWYLKTETRTGIVVGIRQYQDGHNEGYESIEFVAERRFLVVLVAHKLHRKPDAVLPEGLRKEPS